MESPVVVVTGHEGDGLQSSAERGAREKAREPAKANVIGESARPPPDALAQGTDEETELDDAQEDRELFAHVALPPS
jgi:hypothetical protein